VPVSQRASPALPPISFRIPNASWFGNFFGPQTWFVGGFSVSSFEGGYLQRLQLGGHDNFSRLPRRIGCNIPPLYSATMDSSSSKLTRGCFLGLGDFKKPFSKYETPSCAAVLLQKLVLREGFESGSFDDHFFAAGISIDASDVQILTMFGRWLLSTFTQGILELENEETAFDSAAAFPFRLRFRAAGLRRPF
jgi:hypothetical protein